MRAAEKIAMVGHVKAAAFRPRAGVGLLCALVLLLLALPASPSFAAEHTEITGEYGKEGPKSLGLAGCRIAWDSGAEHLLDFGEGQIFGLAVSPGSATPLGGNFPINTEIGTSCGEPDMDVDSGTGQIYAVQSGGGGQIFAWSRSGEKLSSPWPVQIPSPREICGVDVGPDGGPWGGNYSGGGSVVKFKPDGTSDGTIPAGTSLCKLAVNRANGDVFIQPYFGGEIFKLSAASGYTEKTSFPAPGSNEPGMAVNGAEEKLYVTSGSTILAYNTETAALVETVNLPGFASGGVAVDENTDTLFATVGSGSSGYIVEYLGLTTPKATTGEPTANSEVSGTADPNGVGPITECYFEYGTSTAYEIEPGVKGEEPCMESTPFNTVETVHAVLPNLIGEQTYHYRLVLKNGEPHVVGKGTDKTIVPHNVKGLKTEPATNITHDSATLNASFEGTNEDTHYYFEWGQTANFGHITATPPGDDAGITTGPTEVHTDISNLDPGITYHFRVVAKNSLGVSAVADKTFTTTEPPSIDSATTSHLTATTAHVDVTINPHGFETEYFVEYGVTTKYGQVEPVPIGVLGPATTPQNVAIPLEGLNGGVYHFRVVAQSQEGTVQTEDQTFNFSLPECPNSEVRQQNESQYLPDCRAYELVTPEITGNIELYTAPMTPDTYAENPPRFAYGGGLGGLKGNEPTNSAGDTYVATRTSSGWKSNLVGLRGYESQGDTGLLPNSDLTRFFTFWEGGFFEGEPQPPNRVPYIFDVEGNPIERWPTNYASIPGAEGTLGALQPSPDLSHYAITSTNVEWAPGGQVGGIGSAYDYNPATEEMNLISLDEEGNPIQAEPGNTDNAPLGIYFPRAGTRSFLSEWILFDNGNTYKPLRERPDPVSPPISTDGTHILMATSTGNYDTFTNPMPPVRLYMSVYRGGTIYDHYEVSKKKGVTYVGMTPDGSKVFFTSPEQLTSEDTDTSVDLYMWSEETNELTLISKAGPGADGTGNEDSCSTSFTVKCGAVPVYTHTYPYGETDTTFSDSGEIYFYSPEQLDGSKGVPGRENMYLYSEGKPHFVASLDPTPIGEGVSGPVSRMQVSSNGDFMAMITKSRLTSYNNGGFEEMYFFNPKDEKIICVSCKPDGSLPTFNVEGSKAGRFMSDDGRVFFATQDPLTPPDTNEALDVYEYSEGRPQLITTGSGTSEAGEGSYGGKYAPPGSAGLAGVSANGVDVYFATRDVLVPQNHNGPFLAFYDARSNGGFAYVPPLAPCEAADECHGEGNAAPVHPGVASGTDLGDRGNAPNPATKKQKTHKKHKKHKKHKSKKHKRHHKSRHAGRSTKGGN